MEFFEEREFRRLVVRRLFNQPVKAANSQVVAAVSLNRMSFVVCLVMALADHDAIGESVRQIRDRQRNSAPISAVRARN